MLYNTNYVKQKVIFYAVSIVSSLLQIIVYSSRFVAVSIQFLLYGWTALVGLDLLVAEVSRSHLDSPLSVRLLRTSDRSVAETSTRQHTPKIYSCPLCDSNPQSQKQSGRSPTLQTARPLVKGKVHPCTGNEALYRPFCPQGE